MNGHMLVSIIIDNCNYGRYLRASIDSALRQSYGTVEVIVVDDGSTDNSREIIASYGAQIVPVLQQNGGQAAAFNNGFAHSHGEIVIFLDADDVLLPDTAQHVVDALDAHPDAAKIQYRMEIIDAAGARTGTIKPAPHVPLLSGDLREHYLLFPDDVLRMPTSANAFPAWVLNAILPIPAEGYRGGADTYLTHMAPLFGPVVSLEAVGAYYRVHGSNNYEASHLKLARVRRSITHSRQTHGYIRAMAAKLGLRQRRPDMLSMSYVVNRMISLKFEPEQHPIPRDQMWRLVLLGQTAAFQRFDAPWMIRIVYALWFFAMGLAPMPIARWLAEKAFFPTMRGQSTKSHDFELVARPGRV
jgi:glycosyltransferase involved in cell wall biosynthesis